MESNYDLIQQRLEGLLEECRAIEATLPRDNFPARTVALSIKEKVQQIINEFQETLEEDSSSDRLLSNRENEILLLLSEGHANKEIAYRLAISPRTVQFHVKSLFDKIGASSRTEVVTSALKKGLLKL